MKQVLQGIFTWSHASTEKKIDFNGWYVFDRTGAAIVDPAPCTEEDLAEIEGMAAPRAILLTNKDHVRRAEEFASRFRVPILIHQADAPLVSMRIGGVYKHGEELPGGMQAIRVADAKSPGECAFLVRRANALIVGDAVIGKPAGQISMLPREKFANPTKALDGVRDLLQHPFDALLMGDGAPIIRGGRKALEQFLASATI
jgi:glyoxylase-like metal-dependent hydrolase (beta-lactamase superfamily II)